MDPPLSYDLRAASTLSKRLRTRAKKYYNFRSVKPGQLHQPHYRLYSSSHPFTPDSGLFLSQETHKNTTPIEHLTPRTLYEAAQDWPRPPKYHHRHKDKLDKRGATNMYENRKLRKNEERRKVRELIGPRDTWEDDEIWFIPFDVKVGCTICLPWNSECVNKKYFDGLENEVDGGWAAHQRERARVLMEEAVGRWKDEERGRLDEDGWSIWSCSDEESRNVSDNNEPESTWTIVDAPSGTTGPYTSSDL